MQLRLSWCAATLLITTAAQAEDYVSVQVLQYNENNSRVSVTAPSIMINKDFGTDYTLNASLVGDAVSGASPTYYDASTGASAYARGENVNASDIEYGNVHFSEKRVAGGLLFTSRLANRDELRIGANGSSENDFNSGSGSLEYMHWFDDAKNSAITLGGSYQYNEITARCVDRIACDASSGASEIKEATAINLQIGISHNINPESYAEVALFYIADDGYLTDPYLNVVRNNNGITADIVGEKRPDKRRAYGGILKYVNAITDNTTLHLSYRYYWDDWSINSHTIDSDLYYELGSDWTFKLGLRYYNQSAANFYSGLDNYFSNELYASSDYRLSDFRALTYKSNVDYKITKAVSLNFSANYYDQTTGLKATYFMTGFRYNF